MPKDKKIDIGLDEILGESYNKINELIGKRFILVSFTTEKVKGYKSPSAQFVIKSEDEERTYSSFSSVLLQQAEKMEDKKLLPVELGLAERDSKDGNSYLTFTK